METLIPLLLVLIPVGIMALLIAAEWKSDGWTVLGRARNKERHGPGLKADLNKNSHVFNGVAQSRHGGAR